MNAIQWSESLASGSQEIDTQHKELFSRINGLFDAVDKAGLTEIAKTVQFLNDYVVFHFGTEEKFMAEYKYSNTSAHKAQHEQFVRTFERLKGRMMNEGVTVQTTQDLKDLCVDWLVNHIKYSDKALGMFLKTKM